MSIFPSVSGKFTWVSLLALLCFCLEARSQSLCNDSQAVLNGFEISEGAVGCHPFKVNVENKVAGATDIKYAFYYQGENASELPGINSAGTSNTYLANPGEDASSFTILQSGKDSQGKTFYSCKNVSVVRKKDPIFSYRVCNNDFVEISFPADSLRIFSKYHIDWGDGTTGTIKQEELPFTISKTVLTNNPIVVEGVVSDGAQCNSKISFLKQNTGPQNSGKARIEKVELIQPDVAQITFSGSFEAKGYKLFVNEAGVKPFDLNTPEKTGVMPGSFNYKITNPDKSYCFVLTKEEPCGGTDVTPDFCTTPITSIDPGSEGTTVDYILHKSIFYDLESLAPSIGNRKVTAKLEIETINDNTRIIDIMDNTSQYFDNTPCPKDVCFRLVSEVTGTLFNNTFSTQVYSNRVCVNEEALKLPALSSLLATYTRASESIEINYDDSAISDIRQAYLWQMDISGNTLLDSSQLSPYLLPAADFVPGSCFAVSYENSCGYTSQMSESVCTPSLTENAESNLIWVINNPFSADSIETITLRIFEDSLSKSPITEILLNSLAGNYLPDLSGFDSQAFFQIVVASPEGNESRSNLLRINKKNEVYIADAFTPNGDGLNDFFEIKGNLKNLKSYHLKIFNRNGKQVFDSEDLTEKWDGTFGNQALSSGIYGYHLFIESQTNEIIEKDGKITLLR